jgi:hypothetical protein
MDDLDHVEALDDVPTTSSLDDVGELARTMISLQASVADLTERLTAETKKLAGVAQHDLPNLFDQLKLKNFTLNDGTIIGIKDKTVASILVTDRQPAFEWMHKHGFGSLVKREVAVLFGRGDAKKAGKLRGYLTRWYKDFVVEDKENIHGGTLNAWARELEENNVKALESGGKVVDFPETIKVTHLREAVVSIPKKAKK